MKPTQTQGDEGCLTMTLNGNMTVKLRYESGGQEVMVGVQGNTLTVRMTDGTEFRMPLNRSERLKAVA